MTLRNYQYLSLFILYLMLSSCQVENQQVERFNIYDEIYTEKTFTLGNRQQLNLDLSDHLIGSFFVSNRNDIYLFDLVSARIHKIDSTGSHVSSTGGFGRGPGEFVKESNAILTYCGTEQFFAIDWNQARLQIFDLDLNLLHVISLSGTPFDLSCVGDGGLAVLYSNLQKIDIISYDGIIHEELNPKIPHENSKESIFKHFIHGDEGFHFFAYYFKPELLMVDQNGSLIKEIILSDLVFEEVHTAVRNVSILNNEMHLFYNNINPNLSKNEGKWSHVFEKSDGTYLYSYKVNKRFNNYQLLSDNRLIALEDALQSLAFYDFNIDD